MICIQDDMRYNKMSLETVEKIVASSDFSKLSRENRKKAIMYAKNLLSTQIEKDANNMEEL